ncbi:MAG: PAS domain S-box protein [Streptosporangiaceae bacterium]
MGIQNADHAAHSDTALLAAIVESSDDAIIGKTLDGVITTWNAGAQHIYGYTAEEIIGHNMSQLIPPDLPGELPSIFDKLRRGQRIQHYETRRLHKDGHVIDVSVTISPILDAHGTVIGASAIARDITERNRAEAARRAAEEQLRKTQRMETIGQLAGGIAHDFNNLLTVIMSYATLAVAEIDDQPAARADILEITRTARRAAALTMQLLTFSRRDTAQPEPADLNAVIADLSNLLGVSIGNSQLRIDPAAALPSIYINRAHAEQVLLNLAINARDAMPHGGAVTIATSTADLGEQDTGIHPGIKPGRYVQLTVSDTGAGMSADTMERIFEPFFTTKLPGQGTGLGLSTVYGIVTRCGGGVTIESEEGTGTAFHLYFPAIGSPAIGVPAQAAPARTGNGETILVVDDQPAVLSATARILSRNGYTTLEASTSDQALSMAPPTTSTSC